MMDLTIYHIIDHAGVGTIHRLLYPLQDAFECHKVFTRKSPSEFLTHAQMNDIVSSKNKRVIIHSTGKLDDICRKAIAAFQLSSTNGAVFLHTSYGYQKIKGRGEMLETLRELQRKHGFLVFTPSKEVALQYIRVGISAYPVQLGIPGIKLKPQCRLYREELSRYYNKYVTTCSSEKYIYRYVKGIDRFIALSQKYSLQKECLIAGITAPEQSVEAYRFSEDNFLNVLYHSKAYIQLSRFESYNLTAAWAKQFRVPVLLLGTEGTWSNMGKYACSTKSELEELLIQLIEGAYPQDRLENCYKDSISRETLESFHKSLIDAFQPVY